MKRVVVIGSNSFSGSHFIDLLLEKGEYNVIGISRSHEKKDIYLPYKKRDLNKYKFCRFDLNKDMSDILKLLDKFKPEYIVNFASQSIVGASWNNPDHWYRTNVLSTIDLAQHLKDVDYLKKYVHVSTPEVYGNCTDRIMENEGHNPSTPYAGSRSAADVLLQMFLKQYNFPVVFTRAANVYGHGQQLFKIIPRSVIYIKKGIKIPLHGGGDARRSFIHIRDVCEATVSVMENAAPGDIYHLSTDSLISIRDLVKLVCDKMGVSFDVAAETVGIRRGLDNAYILDSSKAKSHFDWEPKIDLGDGVNEVIKWVEDNWDTISSEPLDYIHKE